MDLKLGSRFFLLSTAAPSYRPTLTDDADVAFRRSGHVEVLSFFGLDEPLRNRHFKVRQGHRSGRDKVDKKWRVQVVGDAIVLEGIESRDRSAFVNRSFKLEF